MIGNLQHWNICLEPPIPESYYVLRWLGEEWDAYVTAKFGDTQVNMGDDDMAEHGIDEDSWWWRQITQYVDRARTYGYDDPRSRQAMGKAIATMIAATASMIRVHGDMPIGGHTSGEIHMREG